MRGHLRYALVLALALVLTALPARAQFGALGKIGKRVEQFRELQITDEEEAQLGESVSAKIRTRYGVVQEAAVHKYVGLVGLTLAKAGDRPNLPYKFIVLDTDGVNAYAAPGGYVHITRGALALLSNESELADVLAHEVIHVTEKHTMKAIQKGKMIQMGASETAIGKNPELFQKLIDKTTELVLAGFGRGEELEADEKGISLANKVGYNPIGLKEFLTRLTERNKNATIKQGLFASHPEMQERLTKITKLIADKKLTATAVLAERFQKFIQYKPVDQTEISVVTEGAAGLAGGTQQKKDKESKDTKKEEKAGEEPGGKKTGLTLARLKAGGGAENRQSAEVTGSGGARGVDVERTAKGGSNPNLVAVKITDAELTQFKKEGGLKS